MRHTTGRNRHREQGQALLLFVLFLVVLLVFIGLGVDVGFAYVTKAKLSKAVDAASLMAAANISAGQNTAKTVAENAFYANYRVSGLDAETPVPDIKFSEDANNNVLVDVSATASINTFFVRVLPVIGGASWSRLTVGSSAQATRAKVIMSLILDRSGSMKGNGGADAMPDAVTSFINVFDDNRDYAALVTFASTPAIDVPIEKHFKSDIIDAVNRIYPNLVAGSTFSQGGLTNALVQNQSVPIGPGDNAVKVTVFFTDGKANGIQDTLGCIAPTPKVFGGRDSTGYFAWSPTLAEGTDQSTHLCGVGASFIPDNTPPTTPPTSCGCTNTQFVSNLNGGALENFTQANIAAEAEYRSEQVADDMRANNTIVYAIGMGNDINTGFLVQIANADGSRGAGQRGLALVAPTPADISETFQRVANDILLRLIK